ncbi:IclR family transcriptional regulator [Streptomyces longwoodensis]|uniref:IclR family transcriptional regulator n=1 Tax=Streptomyces longwoodensis TaxID=68231 RepID=UPI00340A0425
MTTPHSAPPERSVVDRTLSILGAFDRDNRTLSLSDISRRSGLPVATVHRIVNKLHGWGALERSAEGGYSIGLRLWETAVLAPRASTLAETAQPHLIGLQRQTGGVTTVAVRDGREAVCLTFVSSEPDPGPYDAPGRRVPLHATALGLTLLAHAGSLVQHEVCAGPLRAHTPKTVTDGPTLTRCLAKVRREGSALVHGAFAPGRGGFAVPVRDARGAVIAAVGVIGPVRLVQPAKVAGPVHAAATMISRALRTEGVRPAQLGA